VTETGKKRNDRPAKKRLSKRERRVCRQTGYFLIPGFLGTSLFYIIPFIVVLYYSMIDNIINEEFVFFDNFILLFNNSAFTLAAKNTLIFSLIAVPLAVAIPLFLAVQLENTPGSSFFRTVLISPLMVPVASVVLIWEVLFHYNGAFNELLIQIGLIPIDWFKSEWSRVIIVVLYLWKNVGYNMILFMSALGGIPRAVIESAELDGASNFRIFWKVKFPFLSSSIFFVAILSLINSFKVFREVYLLTGDYPYDSLYMLQHFMNNTFVSLDYQKLSAAAIIMCGVMIVIIGVLFLIDAKIGKDIEE